MKAFFLFGTTCALAILTACRPAKTEVAKPIPAVQLSKKLTEADLAVVTLTAEAERRLGIQTVPTARKKIALTRIYGGELILPLGRAAGIAGEKPESKSIYSLLPGMTATDLMRAAEQQVDADGLVAAAKVQLEGAHLVLHRAEELMTSKAGVGRTVDDARLQTRLAEVALKSAQAKRALLGTAVFDAIGTNPLWIRVPVYVGELNSLQATQPAQVKVFGRSDHTARLTAVPVGVPFSATTNPMISELFFEISPGSGDLRPGMKVEVTLTLHGEEESLVAPAAGILHDIHGNTWVYEALGGQAYTRRRVEVRRILGSDAVLARGPRVGTKIVTDGAAELFGTEFGAGK